LPVPSAGRRAQAEIIPHPPIAPILRERAQDAVFLHMVGVHKQRSNPPIATSDRNNWISNVWFTGTYVSNLGGLGGIICHLKCFVRVPQRIRRQFSKLMTGSQRL